jgi:ABC-type amino acid transport substrate-binding protein
MRHENHQTNFFKRKDSAMGINQWLRKASVLFTAVVTGLCVILPAAAARDLDEIVKSGRLRHLGIPYANFVTNANAGLDVELMQQFAAHLGVAYELVETKWPDVLPDLTGRKVKPRGDDIEIGADSPVRGDIIATGFTILPWRTRIVDFSEPTFPSGVWLIARADSTLQPIQPSGNTEQDIRAAKNLLKNRSVLGLKESCLDPDLYCMNETGAEVKLFPSDRNLDEMIPAVIARMADATLMDVPVALVALEQWPGEIKVLGPVSPQQGMGCAFSKSSPNLRQAFNEFFRQSKANGNYQKLVAKYYPSVFTYYPEFFKN